MNKTLVLHSALLILHVLDLACTSTVMPAQEANPLMRTLWIDGGFGAMILAKVVVWVFMLAYNLALLKWLPQLNKAIWASQIPGLAAMVALVTWNLCMVL